MHDASRPLSFEHAGVGELMLIAVKRIGQEDTGPSQRCNLGEGRSPRAGDDHVRRGECVRHVLGVGDDLGPDLTPLVSLEHLFVVRSEAGHEGSHVDAEIREDEQHPPWQSKASGQLEKGAWQVLRYARASGGFGAVAHGDNCDSGVLLVPEEAHQEHLNILAGLAELLGNEEFCRGLRNAGSDEELYRFAVEFKL